MVFLFLLLLFFMPGGAISLDVAKSTIVVLGVIVAVLVFIWETWREKKLEIPWHLFILISVLLPLVYALSALLSTPSSLSFLGYNFEVGTFGFILFGVTLLILAAMIFSGASRVLQALVVFFVSISAVALFVAIKVFFGLSTLFGVNNMANPIGNWTDLGVAFGLVSIFAALAAGMIPMRRFVRVLVYAIFALGVALLVVVNFSTAFVLALAASIVLTVYFWKVEKHFSEFSLSRSVLLPIILGVISLIFLINPTISESRGTLSNVVAKAFKVENIDVRPSLSATLGISKAVLVQGGLLGSGPNTFGRDWLIYKPVNINTTPFWAVAFPFGVGFIPTQIASTGILGTALWLIFFVMLVLLGVKATTRLPESRMERFTLVSTFSLTLLLWAASFLYVPSMTVLIFAFIFSGLCVAVSRELGTIPTRVFSVTGTGQSRFMFALLVLVIVLGAGYLGRAGFGRTISAYYFNKAVTLSNTEGVALTEIEKELDRAVKFFRADTYYVSLSRINFAKARLAANATTGTPEENRAAFESALRKSIEAAKSAVSINPAGYQNWVSLGMIYSALVPSPLSVVGAYENAYFAYVEASKRNPLNPEIPLLLARLELGRDNKEAARLSIRNALALKEDYADAYLLLAQLEVQEGNTTAAIASAERLALLVPNNAGVYFELGLLEYANKDYAGAAKAFSNALVSAPDYANAKYYLGLALAQLGQLEEARAQFEDLIITNPDSQEVRVILEDLQADKRSFLNSAVKN